MDVENEISYEAPVLVEIGDFEELTKGAHGPSYDYGYNYPSWIS